MISIGENIRTLRKKAGLTQKQLAERAEVNEVTIRSYEAGKYVPKIETLIKIAEALNCEVSDIDESIIVHRHALRLEPTPEDIERYKKNQEAEKLIQKKVSGKNITENEQKKIDDYLERKKDVLPRFRESIEKFSNAVDKWGENILIDRYRKLNNDGKREAIKRIDELTEIPRYNKENEKETNTIGFSKELTPKKDYLLTNAAHADESSTEITDKLIQAEEDIMDDINFGKI